MKLLAFFMSLFFIGCVNQTNSDTSSSVQIGIELTFKEANRLSNLPLKCIQQEYPNKLGQTISDSTDIASPKILHPAFYGCFDWHSAVHGHWMLVRLMKEFENLDNRDKILTLLNQNLSPENIKGELDYFNHKMERSFERTYGWAWLLKLAEELHTWEHENARNLELNLQPLTDLIVQRYLEFLPKLNYPIRVGEHTNTAFGLSFALDYAIATGHADLVQLIKKRARDFYFNDAGCPITWEPGGYDFLSPCLEEANLMRKVLSKSDFETWLNKFLPVLKDADFSLSPGEVSDRSDGKLVHLDGVNFSRAWCLYGISSKLQESDHLLTIANSHIEYSLRNIVDGAYEGEHWLASFALYAILASNKSY